MRNGNRVRANVLSDAPGFFGRHIRFADHVKQRRLAVVNVAHDGHHRRAQLQLFGLVLDILFDRLGRGVHDARAALPFLCLKPEAVFGAQFLRGDFVDGLVDVGEDTQFHQICD